jgi:hypothetical protein
LKILYLGVEPFGTRGEMQFTFDIPEQELRVKITMPYGPNYEEIAEFLEARIEDAMTGLVKGPLTDDNIVAELLLEDANGS